MYVFDNQATKAVQKRQSTSNFPNQVADNLTHTLICSKNSNNNNHHHRNYYYYY